MKDIRRIEEIEQRWNKTQKSGMIAGGLPGLSGLFCLVYDILETLSGPSWPLSGSLTLLVLGLGHLLCGCWIIFISLKKNRKYPTDAVIAYESGMVLMLGWIIWLFAELLFMLGFIAIVTNEEGGVLFSVSSAGLMLVTAALFSDCRNCGIVLDGDRLAYRDVFGREKLYHAEDIGSAKWILNDEICLFLNPGGKRLFWFHWNAPGIMRLTYALPGAAAAITQTMNAEKEKKTNPPESLHSPKEVWHVRLLAVILFIADLLLMLTLILLYLNTDWLKARWYYLMMNLIPLDLVVFSWLFPSVVMEPENPAESGWMDRHVSLRIYNGMLFLIGFVLNYRSLSALTQCVEGDERMFLFGAVLFVSLFLISRFRFGRSKSHKRQLELTSVFLLGYCIGLTQAIFMISGAGTQVHTPAQIVDLDMVSRGRYSTYYYATVVLENGNEEELEITQAIYECIQNGENVVLCTWTGLLDTKFAAVHLP